MGFKDQERPARPTPWQRLALRQLRRRAGRKEAEPLEPDDWEAVWKLHETPMSRAVHRGFLALPSSPRCAICGAPFAGPGRWLVGPLGFRPSRKNPSICATCVELSPPGGMKMHTGVLFADLRGFTASSEGVDPERTSSILRRFYRCAEDVLFPEAVIDKLIGDEVMALYLTDLTRRFEREDVPEVMLGHAMRLLKAVGYGSDEGPFVEMGIGLDAGEAFVGNIGQRALYDFTAVGDVVNTASRLQGVAAGGQIVISERVAEELDGSIGAPEQLSLKGKSRPEVVYRIEFQEDARMPPA